MLGTGHACYDQLSLKLSARVPHILARSEYFVTKPWLLMETPNEVFSKSLKRCKRKTQKKIFDVVSAGFNSRLSNWHGLVR